MKDMQNVTIGLLLVTAVILGAMLVSSYMTADRAAYADTPVKQADYVLGTGAWAKSTDLVYVLDIAARRLNVYFMDTRRARKDMQLIDRVDLNRAFGTAPVR